MNRARQGREKETAQFVPGKDAQSSGSFRVGQGGAKTAAQFRAGRGHAKRSDTGQEQLGLGERITEAAVYLASI